jgi:hypothetical protein
MRALAGNLAHPLDIGALRVPSRPITEDVERALQELGVARKRLERLREMQGPLEREDSDWG